MRQDLVDILDLRNLVPLWKRFQVLDARGKSTRKLFMDKVRHLLWCGGLDNLVESHRLWGLLCEVIDFRLHELL